MRILIYGAGVIGCLYATLFSEAGYEITVYARNKRLVLLNEKGLLYYKDMQVKTANVDIIDTLGNDDIYDFVFLTAKENQVHAALKELKNNRSPNIVTMVNTIEKYDVWGNICGEGRIIPAFPGAGGSFQGNVLKASLTPRVVQPTTFGEVNGENAGRFNKLEELFKKAKIPYQIVRNMHLWQLCHLALVVPMADAYYEARCPDKAGNQYKLMFKTAKRIKRNFRFMKIKRSKVSPTKMNMILYMPVFIIASVLSIAFRSRFGNTFMYQHSMKAQDEMMRLREQFYECIKNIDRNKRKDKQK